MVPPNTCNNLDAWASWEVYGTYFLRHNDATLNTSDAIIIDFSGSGGAHVAYASQGASGAPSSLSISHIISSGESPTTGTIYKHTDNSYKLTISSGTYYSTGYWTIKSINVTGQNKFWDGSTFYTNQGVITVGGSSGTSPQSPPLNWTQSQTATATSPQDWPSGYRQYFQQWTQVGQVLGTSLQISIRVMAGQAAYQAEFYQAVGVTFTPADGGGITVDGQTRTSTYTKYAKINPSPAEQVSATAVNTSADRVDHIFAYWTNTSSSDTSYSYSISFYPTSAVTYIAKFNAKPLQAENVYAGGTVGNPVEITWTEHPHSGVSYKIYRRVKPLGGSTGPEQLIATLSHGTTSYTDYDYNVTSTYSNDLLSYDVRSYFSENGSYSDPNFVQVFGSETKAAPNPEETITLGTSLPEEFAVSSYPNPFNPSTTISYQLVEDASVTLEIFDIVGRKVATLLNEQRNAGFHWVRWEGKDTDGKQLSSGIYLYRFLAVPVSGKASFRSSGKLVMAK